MLKLENCFGWQEGYELVGEVDRIGTVGTAI